MPEIGTSSSMSGDGKRGVGHWPQATAPILDSTKADERRAWRKMSAFEGKTEVNQALSSRLLLTHLYGPAASLRPQSTA